MTNKDIATQFAAELIEQLKAGTAPWQKPWEAGIPQPPFNPTTGTVYRGINRVMLGGKGFDDPRWMTLKQANQEGYRVKKGEKSSKIVFWRWSDEKKVLDKDGKPVLDDEGKPKMEKLDRSRPLLQIYSVFHASQLQTENGKDLPLFGGKELSWNPIEKAEEILKNSSVSIAHDQGDRAYYSVHKDEIHLPPRERFPSEDRYYSTALHELGHSTGHPSRLNREFGPFGSETYAKEELRAEIASWMISQELGIPHDPGQHAAYVGSWIQALESNPYEILYACQAAEKIMEHVMELEQKQEVNQQVSQTTEQEREAHETTEGHKAIATEINRAMADVGRWDDLGAAREANKHASTALLALTDGDEKRALESMQLAVEIETDQAAGIGPSFTACLVHLKSMGQDRAENRPLEAEPPSPEEKRRIFDKLAPHFSSDKVLVLDEEKRRGTHEVQTPGAEEHFVIADDSFSLVTSDKGFGDFETAAKYPNLTAALESALEVRGLQQERLEGTELFIYRVDAHNDVAKDPVMRTGTNREMALFWRQTIGKDLPSFLQEGKLQPPPVAVLQEKTYLDVKFKEKDAAKAAGAKWDRDAKQWYAPEGTSVERVSDWLPAPEKTDSPVLPPEEEFGQAIRSAGLILEGSPIMDGQVHRVPVENGTSGAKDGAYCGYTDGHPNGWVQNFKTGEQTKWIATGHALSGQEKSELQSAQAERMEERRLEMEARQDKAKKRAYAVWMNGSEVNGHAYLTAKGVENIGLKQDNNGHLLVPGYDPKTDRLQTLQRIGADGSKQFEKDCPKKGACYIIASDVSPEAGEIFLAEGYATGASLHMATGKPVAVAFDADNLLSVATALREKYPDTTITICADNDHKRNKNVGVEKAQAAAQAVNGKVVIPTLTAQEKEQGMTDFNDIHRSRGLTAVAEAFVDKDKKSELER